MTGRNNSIASDIALISSLIKNNPKLDLEVKLILSQEPVGIGIRKNDSKLKEYLNEFINRNMKNGVLPEKYKKYLGFEIPKNLISN